MDAVLPAGTSGVAVPTAAGPTVASGRIDAPPSPAKAAPVAAVETDVAPRLLSAPSSAEMRALYPETARREGREANVSLSLLISTSGQVEQVRVLRSAGQDFDEVATKLVKGFRFSAGRRAGAPVAVWLPWTYRFRLDG